ncbi:MAG: uridylate kinase [Methanotrichaceae archaeon]
MPFFVLKIGGSLITSAKDLMLRLFDLTAEGYSFLVIPGGGPMADLVRDLFTRMHISEEAAHWMAILAMEQYAYLLADGTGARLTHEIKRANGLVVLLPYHALLENDDGLCHSWDYTSDSVAAIVAARLDADIIKATDVDGIVLEGRLVSDVCANDLIGRRTCIDQGTLGLLKSRRCWILNGSDPQKFISMLKTGTGGTVIKG